MGCVGMMRLDNPSHSICLFRNPKEDCLVSVSGRQGLFFRQDMYKNGTLGSVEYV